MGDGVTVCAKETTLASDTHSLSFPMPNIRGPSRRARSIRGTETSSAGEGKWVGDRNSLIPGDPLEESVALVANGPICGVIVWASTSSSPRVYILLRREKYPPDAYELRLWWIGARQITAGKNVK